MLDAASQHSAEPLVSPPEASPVHLITIVIAANTWPLCVPALTHPSTCRGVGIVENGGE